MIIRDFIPRAFIKISGFFVAVDLPDPRVNRKQMILTVLQGVLVFALAGLIVHALLGEVWK